MLHIASLLDPRELLANSVVTLGPEMGRPRRSRPAVWPDSLQSPSQEDLVEARFEHITYDDAVNLLQAAFQLTQRDVGHAAPAVFARAWLDFFPAPPTLPVGERVLAIDFTPGALYLPFCWVVVDAGRLCVVDAGQALTRTDTRRSGFDERVMQLCKVLPGVIIQHNVGRIVYLEHRCVPQLEINGLPAVSVGRREARQALCGWTAMLHELEDQVEAFFEFDVTIGSCVADALCAAWWLIQQGPGDEDRAPRRGHLPRPARRPRSGRLRRAQGKGPVM